MSDHLILLNLLLVILSSCVFFFLISMVIEAGLYLFKIKHPRIRAYCRVFPIIKIPIDLLCFKYLDLLHNFNPFGCGSRVNQIIINLNPEIGEGPYSIITRWVAMHLPISPLFNILIAGILLAIFTISGIKALKFVKAALYLRTLYQTATPCLRPIFSHKLSTELLFTKALILTTKTTQSPFAVGSKRIFIAEKSIQDLTQDEYEAVIAHELEHLRWKDPLIKMLCIFICSIFWWAPATKWLKKFEEEIEQACDMSIKTYHLNNHALASAIFKVMKRTYSERKKGLIFCQLTRKDSVLKRLQSILDGQYSLDDYSFIKVCTVGLLLTTLTFISVWIC